jgi:hypothetical protein
MPDSSKCKDQMKCSPWSSRLGVGHGANNPTLEKIYCHETLGANGGGKDPHRVVSPAKKIIYISKNNGIVIIIISW